MLGTSTPAMDGDDRTWGVVQHNNTSQPLSETGVGWWERTQAQQCERDEQAYVEGSDDREQLIVAIRIFD